MRLEDIVDDCCNINWYDRQQNAGHRAGFGTRHIKALNIALAAKRVVWNAFALCMSRGHSLMLQCEMHTCLYPTLVPRKLMLQGGAFPTSIQNSLVWDAVFKLHVVMGFLHRVYTRVFGCCMS